MPVARIVTRVAPESPELKQVAEQLSAAGYEVVLAPPGSAGAADLLIELDQLPGQEALDAALQLSRRSNADLYLAPGLFAVEEEPLAKEVPGSEYAPPVEDAPAEENRGHQDESGTGSNPDDYDRHGTRTAVADTILAVRVRAAEAWAAFRQQRAEVARQRRLERIAHQLELEQRRREHEIELQRRAEEKAQLLAERERLAAEQERVLREQMARDAAQRAERERAEREAMALEAARRAETAYAQEQERRRLAAREAEQLRLVSERESQLAAAREAERMRAARDQEVHEAGFADSPPLPAQVESDARRVPRRQPLPPAVMPRPAHPRRRIPSRREQRWQRAAFITSVAALAAMLGFAIAANMGPSTPIPASVMQNSAEQQVPFGPAKMEAGKANSKVAAPLPRPALARQGREVPKQPQAGAAQKPSPAKPAPRPHVRRASANRDDVAEDEVVVRHAPTSRTQRAQTQRGPTTAGVRRYSDDN